MVSLRSKLLIPTLLIALLFIAGIGYRGGHQYSR